MILTSKRKFWRKHWAWFPIVLDDGPTRRVIWGEWVWLRDDGFYTSVSLFDPDAPSSQTEASQPVHDEQENPQPPIAQRGAS